jgi:ATP-binding cassette subfamily B protein
MSDESEASKSQQDSIDCKSDLSSGLRFLWRRSKVDILALAVLVLSDSFLIVASSLVAKTLLDAILKERGRYPEQYAAAVSKNILELLALQCAIITLAALVEIAQKWQKESSSSRIANLVDKCLIEISICLELEVVERPATQDLISRIKKGATSRPLLLLSDLVKIVAAAAMVFAYGIILAKCSLMLVAGILLIAAVGCFWNIRSLHRIEQLERENRCKLREKEYLIKIGSTERFFKELRSFGFGVEIVDRIWRLGGKIEDSERRLRQRRYAPEVGIAFLFPVFFLLAQWKIVALALEGKCTIGEMTLYIVAIRQVRRGAESVVDGVAGLFEAKPFVNALGRFLSLRQDSRHLIRQAANVPERGVRFDNVSFRYPGCQSWALRNLTFHLLPGESLAVVGVNGSGKSTLVKLLVGLYQPTEGSVAIDGQDIRLYPRVKLVERMAILFQDYNRYDLSLRDNLSFRSAQEAITDRQLHSALMQAELKTVVDEFEAGLETRLGKLFADSRDLSGGQWQKLALARAFVKERADIVIFDEPTAALDATAEGRLYELLKEFMRGKSAVVVTHRMSAARIADKILVLSNGKVAQVGTHQELIRSEGPYSVLFEAQASKYA